MMRKVVRSAVEVLESRTLFATTLSINDVSIAEGNSGTKSLTFTVTRSGTTSGSSTAKWATQNNTAGEGDYGVANGTISFASGQTTKSINITIKGDAKVENDEVFRVNLTSPNGATIADAQGLGTIVNDDGVTTPTPTPTGTPTLSVGDVSGTEGNSGSKGFSFNVTRTGDISGSSTVKWTTKNGSAGEGDYQVANGTVSFAAGQTVKTIIVAVKGDTKVEGDETFRIVLSSPTGSRIVDEEGVATIVNDDGGTPTDPNDPSGSVERQSARHQEFLNRIKQGPIGLLFIGDSITDQFDSVGQSVYDANYSQYKPANFGISGDQTQNVIWRITHGELDGIDPDVVVLQIGTNNLSSATDSAIAAGIAKIVQIIRDKLPNTKILLLGMFPRANADDPRRERIKNINSMIDDLDDGGAHVKFLDIGDKFLDSNGEIPTDVMNDGLHPTKKGYQIWADAMRPTLESLI